MRLIDAVENRGDDVAAVAAVGALQAAQVGEQAGALRAIGADGFVVVDEGDQFVAGDAVRLAAQSRQRYGGSMAGRNFLPRSLASSSRICSMSSRNLRNMIQVSIGRRSRSPLRPLSFRMMSRQDLTMARPAARWLGVDD